MNLILQNFVIKRGISEIFPRSTVKRFTKQPKKVEKPKEYRENPVKIQMISTSIFNQIFKEKSKGPVYSDLFINNLLGELNNHGIILENSTKKEDINLKLPKLKGSIEDHFYEIAQEQAEPYQKLIDKILNSTVPDLPKEWNYNEGWTKYCSETDMWEVVPFPDAYIMVFDVEVCMREGQAPTLAVALSDTNWYSWCSPSLVDNSKSINRHKYTMKDFVNLETAFNQRSFPEKDKNILKPKVVIGHNVSFDRAKVKEQYWLENTGLRFLDTMSLHVCVSGVTSYQRAMLKSSKNTELDESDLNWSSQSSLNNLADVYKLYCRKELSKEDRNIFVEGSLEDIRSNFQQLMTYCANDVLATYNVINKLYPMFRDRFSHPATLAGMLEIGQAYLPVNSNWKRYITESELTYDELNIEAKHLLAKRADKTCHLMHENKYEKDLWMWDEDWDTKELKFKKAKTKKEPLKEEIKSTKDEESQLRNKFKYLYEASHLLPSRRTLLPGYPNWYRKLCEKPKDDSWKPEPSAISTSMQIAPKILNLSWEGYPLHLIREQGWGFLVPHKKCRDPGEKGKIPLETLIEKCPAMNIVSEASSQESDEALYGLEKHLESHLSRKDYYSKVKKDKTNGSYSGTGIFSNIDLENCCWFLKLPHKDGASNRVGNPLAKNFITKFSENVLTGEGVAAQRVIELAKMVSYWRNNCDRINSQMVSWFSNNELPKNLREENQEFGAIIPQVVVSGTLTRRAVEPTWMTASNSQSDRVGSELRAMVQAPPGYKIVGADVDSQELWIASILGDAYATGIHGATPLGWMTLSGSKDTKSDMHSVTAQAVGISRDHAKVINYARIYGAGQNFAERLLKQFNPTISDGEARSKAIKMFALTKGKKLYFLKREFQDQFPDKPYSVWEALKLAKANRTPVSEMFEKPKWEGGTESAMFNRLEEIAGNDQPTTPFLEGRLSRALEPTSQADDRFLPTKINWVVQSGAVDFLHLMLVCMRWLMGNRIKFCLSFHDEVRYLVPEEHVYKAALAMHVTNLLTRAYCTSKVGMKDLPMSVAFFSSVEVDQVLRKEAKADCITPSNPHGLSGGYSIPFGETLSIYECISKAGGSDLTKWSWHK